MLLLLVLLLQLFMVCPVVYLLPYPPQVNYENGKHWEHVNFWERRHNLTFHLKIWFKYSLVWLDILWWEREKNCKFKLYLSYLNLNEEISGVKLVFVSKKLNNEYFIDCIQNFYFSACTFDSAVLCIPFQNKREMVINVNIWCPVILLI